MKCYCLTLAVATVTLLFNGIAVAQLPVEFFVGHKKATVDVMFFRFFKNKAQQNSKWLFFNRNRASIDYAMTETTNLPQFGFTEAISYNDKRLKGFAPVVLASIINKGVFPKAGIQFASTAADFTMFSWVVIEARKDPDTDFFFLARYTPGLSEKIRLFTQVELLNAFPTVSTKNYAFTQRVRAGLKIKLFQFGLGADFAESGRTDFTAAANIGGFLRYEF